MNGLQPNELQQERAHTYMADRKAPGALEVMKTPDYEAMVIGAHPDDDDIGVGGTSALWAKQGKKIVWEVMTDRAEGSEGPSRIEPHLMLSRDHDQRLPCDIRGCPASQF